MYEKVLKTVQHFTHDPFVKNENFYWVKIRLLTHHIFFRKYSLNNITKYYKWKKENKIKGDKSNKWINRDEQMKL